MHTISVVAYDAAGEHATAESQRNFVDFPLTFIIIIISVVVVSVIVSSIIAIVWLKKQEAKETARRNA
jgi:flagellar basal body-associated protein FliL